MNKMIISVFDTEEKAFEGLTAFKALHQEGDITMYANAVVNKNEEGNVAIKESSDQGPIGTAVGMFSGTLIGMIGGPPGMAIGALAGSFGGLIYDVNQSDFDLDFVYEVSAALNDGKSAVIVEVDETWTTPVDTRMEQLGAMVFRRNKSEIIDDQLNREVEETNAEIHELKEELKDANDATKENIQKHIDKAKQKQLAMKVLIDTKMEEIKNEADAKYNKLNAQIEDAGKLKKKRLEKRMEKLKDKYKKRKKKFDKAAEKVSEYIT